MTTTDAWGIDDGWFDVAGHHHETSGVTRSALRRAMRGPGDRGGDGAGPPAGRPFWAVRPGAADDLAGPATLVLEDGTQIEAPERLPADLPLGLHRLVPLDGGQETTLLVGPGVARRAGPGRGWGVTAQVPSLVGEGDWGIGDLPDVARLARWVAGRGGAAVGLSPLHAPQPVGTPAASPYYPSSRRWRNPLLLRVDELPGAAGDPVLRDLAARARRSRSADRIDRAEVAALHRLAVEHLWQRRRGDDGALERWQAAQGTALRRWTTYCVLAEHHGPDWTRWPEDLRHPDAPAVARVEIESTDRRALHAWVQFHLERQLLDARPDRVALVQDLAIGVDPGGADAWALQDLLALDVRVGAPPDAFAPDGQDWGLPPFVPWRLRDAGYRPLADLLRAAMTTGGIRIDHVMGLSRLFWVPAGATPAEGTYVRFARDELLEVVAMESARADAVVIGEDLGTVEEGLREELARRHVLSTRLVWFESDPPERYPQQAMAAVTTHDLPTVAGVWTGADRAELVALGRDDTTDDELRDRLGSLAGAGPDEDAAAVAVAVHARLAGAPSVLAVATLEDLCGMTRRPNVPGTVDERPNWSIPLPMTLGDLEDHPLAGAVVAALSRGRTTLTGDAVPPDGA